MEVELHETAVTNALSTKWLGQQVHYYESVGSTNDLLKKQVKQGNGRLPPHGTVILTDFQAQGRGRLDRQWQAPPGTSLLLSVLFRPHWPAERLPWLTMLAGLAVADAMNVVTGLPIKLKWPNDVVVALGGVWHKVCGILLEGNISSLQSLDYAIVGTGMNVNIPAAQLPAGVTPPTSLLVAGGKPVSRLKLLTAYLARLENLYEAADRGESPQPAWQERLITLGQAVQVRRLGEGESLSGLAEGTDTLGQLLVRDAAGKLHAIGAGDVTLRQDVQ